MSSTATPTPSGPRQGAASRCHRGPEAGTGRVGQSQTGSEVLPKLQALKLSGIIEATRMYKGAASGIRRAKRTRHVSMR
jgi:hypothetical protein